MTGNVYKLGTAVQRHLFSFLYGPKERLEEQVKPLTRIRESHLLYIPRDTFSSFAVCKSWRKLSSVENAEFLVWKEIFLRIFSSLDSSFFNYDKSSLAHLKGDCIRRFQALATNIVTGTPSEFRPTLGHTYTEEIDTAGICILWNRWFFTCPQKDAIHGRLIRGLYYDINFSVPEDNLYRDISNFRVAHGKIVARGVELQEEDAQEEDANAPKKEPLPKKLCFHVWDIASNSYNSWEMPGETECKFFQIVDPSTLLVIKSNGKVLRCDLTTGQIKTTLKRDIGGAHLFASHKGKLFGAVAEVVHIFNEESGAYLRSIVLNSMVKHISFIDDSVVLGLYSGAPAIATYNESAKRWELTRLTDNTALDDAVRFSRSGMDAPNAAYARFGDLLWQTSYQREQRVYNLREQRHVRTLNQMGNVGGQLFQNGFGLFWYSQTISTESYTFFLAHLNFDTSPPLEAEPREAKAPEVKEAKPMAPPALGEPAPAPAAPAEERVAPPEPLWKQCISFICNALERFYNWFVNLFSF